MQLSELVQTLEQIAPPEYAESWDNVGLLTGDPEQQIRGIMLTIDYTRAVAAEAAVAQCDLIVSYHPPIFQGLKRLTAGSQVFDAIRKGVAIYSPHTALDVANGGTNDMLADVMGLTDRQPLRAMDTKAGAYKLVVFVPRDAAEIVGAALFGAGAGKVGNYSSCSFRSSGTGTFFGHAGSDPTIGEPGELQRVDEFRLEMLVPIGVVDPVLRALRESHPYEEPAFELNILAPVGAAGQKPRGQGRVGNLPGVGRTEIFDRIKRGLGLQQMLIAGPTEGKVSRGAACAGSCGNLLEDAINAKADIYLTGEMRHHDALRAAELGMTVVCTLHSNSERAVLPRLKEKLEELAGVPPVKISAVDRDPFAIL
jgi:dinuclear metal center YbgI/SA1388 family protein